MNGYRVYSQIQQLKEKENVAAEYYAAEAMCFRPRKMTEGSFVA